MTQVHVKMAQKVKTAKEISLGKAVKEALKNCPALMSSTVVSAEAIDGVDICGCYDENGNDIEEDCVENCKGGNFSATVRINISNGESHIKDISGTFTVTEYDAQNCSFKAEIQQINH